MHSSLPLIAFDQAGNLIHGLSWLRSIIDDPRPPRCMIIRDWNGTVAELLAVYGE